MLERLYGEQMISSAPYYMRTARDDIGIMPGRASDARIFSSGWDSICATGSGGVSAASSEVGPIPFHGMPRYPYPADVAPPIREQEEDRPPRRVAPSPGGWPGAPSRY